MPLSESVLSKYVSPYFFDTGTHNGDAVRIALGLGFERIVSIEIDDYWYRKNVDTFVEEMKMGRVSLFLGDTLNLMPSILSGINARCTFWLDANWDGGRMGEKKCPLYEELDYIQNMGYGGHIIMIYDVRMFGTGNWGEGIDLDTIVAKLRAINPKYTIAFEDGIVLNDILVAHL
jgi:hypothetical protein